MKTPTAFDLAAQIHPADGWHDDLLYHIDHGWVYASPTAFGLAMIKDPEWPDEDLMDLSTWLAPEDLDGDQGLWYFTRVAGNVAEVLSRLPFPLAQAGWHRQRGENTIVHRHDFAKFCRRFGTHPQPVPAPREIGFHAAQRRST